MQANHFAILSWPGRVRLKRDKTKSTHRLEKDPRVEGAGIDGRANYSNYEIISALRYVLGIQGPGAVHGGKQYESAPAGVLGAGYD